MTPQIPEPTPAMEAPADAPAEIAIELDAAPQPVVSAVTPETAPAAAPEIAPAPEIALTLEAAAPQAAPAAGAAIVPSDSEPTTITPSGGISLTPPGGFAPPEPVLSPEPGVLTPSGGISLTPPEGIEGGALAPGGDISVGDATPSGGIAAPAGGASVVKIQAAKKRGAGRPVRTLIHWTAATLKGSGDPLARGITALLEKGAKKTLFLVMSAPPPGQTLPQFLASAAVGADEHAATWTGLRWDPRVVPDLWNHFVKAGVVELPPPGTNTVLTSARNVVRAAFGVTGEDWLTLMRVGPLEQCRGVLVTISATSLLGPVRAILPVISQPLAKKAA